MQSLDNNTQAFLALVRAGLWETDVQLLQYGIIDFNVIYRLAQEQSVVGLVAAGVEHIVDIKVPKEIALVFVGEALQHEQRNIAMNHFIGGLIENLHTRGINAVLVKGQGVAQCYERPLWRAAGDVDLFLDGEYYYKAKEYLTPLASSIEEETEYSKHYGLTIDSWLVELHGSLHSGLLNRIDRQIDEVQADMFGNKRLRVWQNDTVEVPLPSPDNDVVYVFAHILQHFFKSGIGLRQVCDLCRLLWTFRGEIDLTLLEDRISAMGMMKEWKSFASLAVNTLGMSEEAMPYYSLSNHWAKKGNQILRIILMTGNFGHNAGRKDLTEYNHLERKMLSFIEHTKDGLRHFTVFPVDSFFVWGNMVRNGFAAIIKDKR